MLGMYKLFVPVGERDKVIGGLKGKGKQVNLIKFGMPVAGLCGSWGQRIRASDKET